MRRLVAALLILSAALALSACDNDTLVQSALSVEHRIAGLERKTVQVGDHRISYLEGGSGETIMLLHGFGADADNWTRFSRKLTSQYHVIAPDLPGFGQSSRLAQASYSIPAQSSRIRILAQSLGLKEFHLVGNSMGGYIAGYYAATNPQQIRSLALFDAAGVSQPTLSPFFLSMQAGDNLLLVKSREDYRRLLKLVMQDPPWLPGQILDYYGDQASRNREFNKKIFDEIWTARLSLEPLLPNITARTLIVWGREDRVVDPSSVQVFQAGLSNAATRTLILAGVGHAPMIEQPERTAEAYLAFLAAPTSALANNRSQLALGKIDQ